MKRLLLTLTILIFSINLFGQISIKNSEYVRLTVNDKTVDKFWGNDREEQGFNEAYSYKFNNPDSVVTVQFQKSLMITIEDFEIVDTLTITGRWFMTGQYGNYYRFPDYGDIIKIESDTVRLWQKEIEVIRTKSHGKIKYKDTGAIPFQIRDMVLYDITDVSSKIRVHITEGQSEIISYIDNVEYKRFQPGSSEKISDTDWSFWFNILQREPNTSYEIRIEVTSESGHINYEKINLKTLQ